MAVAFEIRTDLTPDAMRALWEELEPRAKPAFFLTWDWIGSWIETAGLHPYLLIGRDTGTVVLLAALVPATRRSAIGPPVHGLHLHATGALRHDIITIEYNGFLVTRDWAGRIEAAAIAFLTSGLKLGGMRFDELHMKTATPPIDTALVASGVWFRQVQVKRSYRVDLDAVRASGKAYLDTLSANTRQQIRRSMRLYEQRGKLLATRATTVDQALTWFDALAELHQAHWQGRGQPGAFAYPYFDQFQRHLLRACLNKGTVELLRVTAGDEAIGYVYNFVHDGHAYAYLTGIKYEADAKLKPGLINHVLCIEAHLAEGAACYDFMAGENRYKANLGIPGPDMPYFVAQRRTLTLLAEDVLRQLKHRIDSWRKPRASEPLND